MITFLTIGRAFSWRIVQLTAAAIVATITLAITHPVAAQVNTCSYQGILKMGTIPVNGFVNMTIKYYDASSGAELLAENFNAVPVTNGVFEVALGSQIGGFPESFDLSKPIELGISINGGAELTPRAQLAASPYSLMAHSIDGILASPTPQDGRIFPIPLDLNHKIDASILPAPPTINNLPAINGNYQVAAGQNVSLYQDYDHGRLVISSASGITGINVGTGLVGGGTQGAVNIGLNPGSVPGSWIQPQSITGLQLSPTIAGTGLYYANDHTLNVAAGADQFNFNGDNTLHLRTDIPVTGTVGSLHSLSVLGNVTLSTWPGSSTTINNLLYAMGGISMGDQLITNLADPNSSQDAATKNYVDWMTNDLYYYLSTDINSLWENKLTNQLPDANIFVGDEEGMAQAAPVTGDATLSDAGSMTVRGIQQTPVAPNAPIAGQYLVFDGERWAPTFLPSIPGLPFAGQVTVTNVGSKDSDEVQYVVYDNNLIANNSTLLLSIVLHGGGMGLAPLPPANNPHYVVESDPLTTNGQFILHVTKTKDKIKSGESVDVHYMIINNQNQVPN